MTIKDAFRIDFTSGFEGSGYENTFLFGQGSRSGSLSEDPGSTASFNFRLGDGSFALQSIGDPNDATVKDRVRVYQDTNGDGQIADSELRYDGRVEDMEWRDLVSASAGGDFELLMRFEDMVDTNYLDQTVSAKITVLEQPTTPGLLIVGTNDRDVLVGTEGNDFLFGAGGGDGISGGAGNDRITGAGGEDRMVGGAGNDVFIFRPNDGRDRILDFDAAGGNDRLNLRLLDIDFADVNQRVTVGGNLFVAFDGSDGRILLDNAAPLTADDFIF